MLSAEKQEELMKAFLDPQPIHHYELPILRAAPKTLESTKSSLVVHGLWAIYFLMMPMMAGIASGLGYSWNESAGVGIIWPLWIPFKVGQGIGKLLEWLT